MGGLLGSPAPPPASPPPPPATDPEEEDRKRRVEIIEKRRRGRFGTVATTDRGLLSESNDSPTGGKKLLGE